MKKQKTLNAGLKDGNKEDKAERLLSLDIGKAVNDPESSDVVFVCKDGKKVHGCRWLLSLRSPVFKGMFSNRMLESNLVDIPFDHISSDALLSVFEYLYTGAVRSNPPRAWKMGFEIIRAAHFLIVPELETIAQSYLQQEKINALRSRPSRHVFAKMLSEALEFKEEWEGKVVVLSQLSNGLRGDLSSEGYLFKEDSDFEWFSENAVEYVLLNRLPSENDRLLNANEYYTFRQVIQWLLYQQISSSNQEARDKLQEILPIEESEHMLWGTIFKYPLNLDEFRCVPSEASDAHDPTTVLNSRLGVEICKESLQRLLKQIKWSAIPAMLLLKVVYPLDVIPAHALFNALAEHALRRSVTALKFDSKLVHGKCFGSLSCSLGNFVCKSKNGLRSAEGRAVAALPMTRSHGNTYEWRWDIAENDAEYILLGIVYGSGKDPWEEHSLGENSLLSCSASRILSISRDQEMISVCTEEPKPQLFAEWERFPNDPWDSKNRPIWFELNPSAHRCRVRFGYDSAALWENLPDAVFHPVIEISKAKSVTAKISSRSGFETL